MHLRVSERRSTPPSPIGLRRSLTLTHVVLYGLGVTIGAGIYVLIAAEAARASMHAPLAFIVTGLLMGLTGASLAELGVRMPVAAGEAAYARAAFRSERIAAAVGFLAISMSLVSAATISAGAAGYIGVFIDLPAKIIIAAVVLAMGAIAARGIVESVAFAGLMTLIEIGGLLIIIAAGFLFEPDIIVRSPEILPLTLDASVWTGIFTASLLAVFAFIGFEGIVNIAEEIKDPSRTLPRGIFLTLAITTVLYVLVMWVALVAVGPSTLSSLECSPRSRLRAFDRRLATHHERDRHRRYAQRDRRQHDHGFAHIVRPFEARRSAAGFWPRQQDDANSARGDRGGGDDRPLLQPLAANRSARRSFSAHIACVVRDRQPCAFPYQAAGRSRAPNLFSAARDGFPLRDFSAAYFSLPLISSSWRRRPADANNVSTLARTRP